MKNSPHSCVVLFLCRFSCFRATAFGLRTLGTTDPWFVLYLYVPTNSAALGVILTLFTSRPLQTPQLAKSPLLQAHHGVDRPGRRPHSGVWEQRICAFAALV